MQLARITIVISLTLMNVSQFVLAQDAFGTRPPEFSSVELSAEKKLTFRVHAPKAKSVKLMSGDLPTIGFGVPLTKGENGIWSETVGPYLPGAYRYNFDIDGVSVIDPRNPVTSESNTNTFSLLEVPGSDLTDLKNVPHGNIIQATYYSESLKRFRRMHVYTPPGYDKSTESYPVLYLLHGAFDSDASWSSVGRAGHILDNLLASKKAKPMVVVMPAGHTGPFRFGPPGDNSFDRQMTEFSDDFIKDLRPTVESRFRVLGERQHRAIAGLSMGGAQTLNIACSKLNDYGYIGVFSSGVFGIAGGFGGTPPSTAWEDQHRSELDNAELKKGLKLVWFGCGKDDFLVQTSDATVKMLRKHAIDVTYHETDGGHTWANWRSYLSEFAPLLFVEKD